MCEKGATKLRVLVTGATGLLGRQVCKKLKLSGHSLVVVGRSSTIEDVPAHERVVVDLSIEGFSTNFPSDIDAVIHLAQAENYRNFPASASNVFRVNLGSTQELLTYAANAGASRFVYASSGGIYKSGAFNLEEGSPLRTPEEINFYLATKLGSELLVQSYGDLFNHVILRFFFIYGPGQKRSMLMPRLYDQVVSGKAIHLDGKEGLVINPVHVLDAAEAVAGSLSLSQSETVNIAGPDQLSLKNIVTAFGRHAGVEPVLAQSGLEGSSWLYANISQMSRLLLKPRRRLLESLDDVAPGSA